MAHRPFIAVAVAAAALRAVVMLGYPPIMWFNDSYNYVTDAVGGVPDPARPAGYAFFLKLLLPVHSLTLVAALQAAMGLATGVIIYAVLRRRGLPWWGATLAALPVLFDAFELQLEHMVMSDVLFIFLVTTAIAMLCWSRRPRVPVAAVAGLMIGCAATVRAVGLPLLAVLAAGLLLRRAGWLRSSAAVAAGIVPVAGYMVWFHGTYGQYAMDEATGAFLYSRVSSFAECAKIKPPPSLRPLCDPRPPADRPNSQEYLWSTNTPLWQVSNGPRATPHIDGNQFTERVNRLTKQFAERAILAQPLAYLRVAARDTLRTFTWARVPSDVAGSGPAFQFRQTIQPLPWWVTYYPQVKTAVLRYGGPSMGQPKVVSPYAGFLQDYEKYVYLRGTILGLIVLAGAAGVAARWRSLGGMVLLPWAAGVALIVVPPMTAGFSYRYVLAAVPVTCLAAGLAASRRQGTAPHEVPERAALAHQPAPRPQAERLWSPRP